MKKWFMNTVIDMMMGTMITIGMRKSMDGIPTRTGMIS
jgi:hypothetical protein